MLVLEEKLSGDTIVAGMDWSHRLADGDTILSKLVQVTLGDVVVSDDAIVGTSINFRVSGGTSNRGNIISVTITTTNGSGPYVGEALLIVR